MERQSTKKEVDTKNLTLYVLTMLLGVMNSGYYALQYNLIPKLENNEGLVYIHIVIIVGCTLTAIFYKTGKRIKMIIANVIILGATIGCMFASSSRFILLSFAFYSAGIGAISINVAFYLREIAPREYLKQILISFSVAYFLGITINSVLYWIAQSVNDNNNSWSLFLLPAMLSSAQLFLQIFIFKHDSPMFLIENTQDEEALMELQRIFPSPERRFDEFRELQRTAKEFRLRYPSYSEMLSKEKLPLLLQGCLISIAKTSTESAVFLYILEVDISPVVFCLVFFSLAILIVFMAFFIGNKLTQRQGLTIGLLCTLIVVLAYVAIGIASLVLDSPGWLKTRIHLYCLVQALGWIVHDIILATFAFIYIIMIMPERGFALIMAFNWVADTIYCTLYFYYGLTNYELYFDLYALISVAASLFISWKIPEGTNPYSISIISRLY